MATIIIRETGKNDQGFTATVQFDTHGSPYEIAVQNPFSGQEEARLEWYFERWLDFPFTDKVLAEEAAASIRRYGETLFEQVFRRNPDVYQEYQQIRHGDFLLEITGSPEFHTLHWETLQDPNQERPLAVDKSVVRKNSQPVPYRAQVQPAPELRVLLVTARPSGAGDVSYRTISRPLVEALETGKVAARIDMVRPGTFKALVEHLEDIRDEHGDGYYHLIHLDMHGGLLTYEQYQKVIEKQQSNRYKFRNDDYAKTPVELYEGLQAFLFFDDDKGHTGEGGNPVNAADLADLLNARQIPIVVLNACQSGKQVGAAETSLGSRLLAAGVQLVVAISYSVTVSAARLLMTNLYKQLLTGREPAVAIRRARLELYNDKGRRAAYGQEIRLEDWMLPVVYQNQPQHFDPAAFRGDGVFQSTTYNPPRTTYGFVGRDIDILEIERHLCHLGNILLIRGMGGAGKTTLLHHLGWWWQKTRFVGQVFYFGYDVKAYHLQEIISRISQQLGLNLSGILARDRGQVMWALKSNRHLLILDNLESVTGERLAVQNTLTPEAQTEVRQFLCELVKGQTLVLLGSRSREAWLRPDPLSDNDVYDLPGLDYEAQTALAEAILQKMKTPRYPELKDHQNDFRRLLKLLGGYPLAMEVVLANLTQATPAQVIERLQAADVNLDNQKETAQKTESILKCIDYSHGNLSSEAQALLLCLAPFTGVINIKWLKQYTDKLKTQPPLAGLPYDRWPEVLQEAVDWGLMEPHEELGEIGYLRLQPVFPYFLKARLNEQGQIKQRQDIEAAFRSHYNGIGNTLYQLIDSKEAQKRRIGQILIGVEYENLMTAMNMALNQHEEFCGAFAPLFHYLLAIQDGKRSLELCETVMLCKPDFSQEQLEGEIGFHFLLVLTRLGSTLLELKRYSESEKVYKEAMDAIGQLRGLPYNVIGDYKAKTYHGLGRVAQEQRQWEAAEGYYKETLQIEINFNDRYSQASTLHQLGMVAAEQRQWAVAEGYYKEALQIFIDFNDCYSQALTLHQLGMAAEGQRQWEAAEGHYKEALQIKNDFNDRYSQASTLHQLGRVAVEQRQWGAAEGYQKEALQIYIDFNDHYSQARTLHELGLVATEQQQWEAAEGYCKEALQIFVDYNDRYSQASTLHQLGVVAENQGQWEAAEGYCKEALQIKIDFKDRYSQASTLHQLGMLAEEQGQWAVAEGYQKEALQIYIDFNDHYSQARTLHQLGLVATEQQQWEPAEGYYKEALQIYIDFNDHYSQASTLGQLGILAEEQQRWTAAKQYVLEAAKIFIQYQDERNLGIALRSLARIWRETQDKEIPRKVGEWLELTVEESGELLRKAGGNGDKQEGNAVCRLLDKPTESVIEDECLPR